jgi:MoaA/NifB/PqqE/SkfB family radical SAM enzyme
MCDIWRKDAETERELTPSDYRWLPRSLRSINVSGGEPFLRDDLVEIVAVMREACPDARIVISTNGSMPFRIEEMISRMDGVAVRISVDAAGPLHDEIRGVPGAYAKAIETARRLKAAGVADLGLAATSTEGNPGQLEAVRDVASDLGLEFAASAAHSSPIFFGAHDAERPQSDEAVGEIGRVMDDLLASKRPRDWAKAYYMRGLADYVRGRPRRLACRAGTDFFFLDPRGDVYPCNISGTRMGNVKDGSFEEIQRQTRTEVREAVASCQHQCWMICTVSPPMRRRPLRPLAWIAGAKLLGLDTEVSR